MPGSFSLAFLIVMCPAASAFVTRFNCRITVLCGSVLSAFGLLGSAFAPDIYVLSIAYGFVAGSGACLVYMAGICMVPLYFDRHRSFALGIVACSGPAAGVLMISPVVQTLIERLGWRKAMLVLGGFNLAISVFGAGITRQAQSAIKDENPAPEKQRTFSRILSSLHCSVLKDPNLILVIIVNCICYMGHYISLIHLVSLQAFHNLL